MNVELKRRNIALLGSTGSIGRQALDVMSALGLTPYALVADKNSDLMEKQIRRYKPKFAALSDKKAAANLQLAVADLPVIIFGGEGTPTFISALEECDTVLCAMSGISGFVPTITALRTGKDVALANKETLVCAGEQVMELARDNGVNILPVDSEHSALWQSLRAGKPEEVVKMILTCSGGPFFGRNFTSLENVKPEEALQHPNWKMGAKVTVDSATLMNKGLELIEAMRLYSLPASKVEIVIHRESVFHSFVEFCDGSVIGQAAQPDMRLPIQYALTYPDRLPSPCAPLSLTSIGNLSFSAPDVEAFKCLRLAREAAETGGSAPAILSCANEEAVKLFLEKTIGFNDIYRAVEYALSSVNIAPMSPTIDFDELTEIDVLSRKAVNQFVKLKG